ncbi:MAG: 1-acyl-sn-glycerol-3-phosphate acyltransferase [Flavobacteriales bacterium]|nr:1-acyl-sn-glycerol-3-phosphate acyltransferase [Flavobacteriales bacterium]MCB9167615.1 1-acyl-sn-glycerol-3-phosphate acyltransferase [Flavobacteriales bacterium]
MGRLFASLYGRTTGRPWTWAGLLVIWAAFVAVSVPRLHFDEDVFQAMPDNGAVRDLRDLLGSTGSSDRVFIGFTVPEAEQLDSAIGSAERAWMAIRSSADSARILRIQRAPDLGTVDAFARHALDELPVLADSAAASRLIGADQATIDGMVADARAVLTSPSGMVRKPYVLGDPAHLLSPFFQGLQGLRDVGGISTEMGVFTTRDGRCALLMLEPRTDLTQREREELVEHVAGAASRACATDVRSSLFGTVPIGLANRSRIQVDATLTLTISIVLIVGLLLWYYRRWHLPFLFLVPPAFGAMTALAVMGWIAPDVSAIALGVAATLMGIALDYSFHFFTHLRHSRDMRTTLRDISTPMLLGSATTVMAFLGLRFMDAKLLRDLGLLAALMLTASALFVLIVMPHLTGSSWDRPRGEGGRFRMPTRMSRFFRRWSPLIILVVTAGLWPFIGDVRFEDDAERLSYLRPDMQEFRTRLFGSQDDLWTVFVVSEDRDEQRARAHLERAVHRLRARSEEGLVSLSAPSDLLPSDSMAALKSRAWSARFDSTTVARMSEAFREAAVANGFRADAFAPFLENLGGTVVHADPQALADLQDLLPGLVEQLPDGRWREVAIGRGPRGAVERAVEATQGMPGIRLLHRGIISDQIRGLIGDDLQRILWITSMLVLVTLLVTYGRIETTLITFLPMLLSWIWILGICGLFGIPFNMVNILVCTFIFGLGDDYCIFTTEGILGKYRDGTDHLPAVRASVVLSAVSTIIGTGVLVFAEHPVLRSIATLSVVGMGAILFISLTFQPLLFRWMITGRAAKGRFPFTLRSLLISLFAFVYFLVGCMILLVLLPLVLLLPIAKEGKRRIYSRVIMYFTRSLVYIMMNTRKDIHGFKEVVRGRPSVVIANHNSFIDILAMLMVAPRMLMMTNRWVWNSPFFGAVVRYTGFIRSEDDVDVNVERLRDPVARGWSVVIFPEGTRSRTGRIGRFHKGPFYLAEKLDLPVVPVVLHGFGYAMGKHDALLKDAHLSMRTLPPIAPDDERFGRGYRERTKRVSAYFRETYREVRDAIETPAYFREQLIRNYIYKGPVLEWYMRIKTRIDRELHERIHALVPRSGSVVDLGCGYGQMTLLLHLSGPDRQVLGVDHDAEKVAVASNCFSRGPGLAYATVDLDTYEPPIADAYLFKDVLHYLEPEAQRRLLSACAERMSPDGRIIVRDGFTGDEQLHKRTLATEFWSINIGFNKAKTELHFMPRSFIDEVAREAGLVVEEVMTERSTSNQLLVLRRPSRS